MASPSIHASCNFIFHTSQELVLPIFCSLRASQRTGYLFSYLYPTFLYCREPKEHTKYNVNKRGEKRSTTNSVVGWSRIQWTSLHKAAGWEPRVRSPLSLTKRSMPLSLLKQTCNRKGNRISAQMICCRQTRSQQTFLSLAEPKLKARRSSQCLLIRMSHIREKKTLVVFFMNGLQLGRSL